MATLKNTVVDDTGSVYLPRGTTAQRPSNPGNGAMRYNTTLGYVEFFFLGFWINAENNKGGVPMEGLLLLADAGNPASWNGSTLTDISGNNVPITISGTVTEQTSNTGSKYLTGGQGAGRIDFSINVSTATSNNFTVMTTCGYNGGTRNRITTTGPGGNNWLLGHWSGGDVRYYAEGWVNNNSSSGGGAANNQWATHTGTGETQGLVNIDDWQYWKNGGLWGRSTGGSNGPTSLRVGAWTSNTNETSDWKWQFLAAWNRVLSEDEIRDLAGAISNRGGF
jgi:hypothetical protein